MPRLDSAMEGKLRAACDRCHDLKNRCVRTGGPESRCDRCERLDIDCVYRNTSRIGRPRTQRRSSVAARVQNTVRESFQDELGALRHGHGTRKESVSTSAPSSAGTVLTESESSGNASLMESPTDVMSLLVSPEGISTSSRHLSPEKEVSD